MSKNYIYHVIVICNHTQIIKKGIIVGDQLENKSMGRVEIHTRGKGG
jgi:hypothetical protein